MGPRRNEHAHGFASIQRQLGLSQACWSERKRASAGWAPATLSTSLIRWRGTPFAPRTLARCSLDRTSKARASPPSRAATSTGLSPTSTRTAVLIGRLGPSHAVSPAQVVRHPRELQRETKRHKNSRHVRHGQEGGVYPLMGSEPRRAGVDPLSRGRPRRPQRRPGHHRLFPWHFGAERHSSRPTTPALSLSPGSRCFLPNN
jgi:hypothetical protein